MLKATGAPTTICALPTQCTTSKQKDNADTTYSAVAEHIKPWLFAPVVAASEKCGSNQAAATSFNTKYAIIVKRLYRAVLEYPRNLFTRFALALGSEIS